MSLIHTYNTGWMVGFIALFQDWLLGLSLAPYWNVYCLWVYNTMVVYIHNGLMIENDKLSACLKLFSFKRVSNIINNGKYLVSCVIILFSGLLYMLYYHFWY